MRKHATADVDLPSRTLCGELIQHPVTLDRRVHVDNADPDCKRCLSEDDA